MRLLFLASCIALATYGCSSDSASSGPGSGARDQWTGGATTGGLGDVTAGGGPGVVGTTGTGFGATSGTGVGAGGGGPSGGMSNGGAGGIPGTLADAAAQPPVPRDGGPSEGDDGGGSDGDNPDADRCAALATAPVVLYQSADDSNSMASPAIARRLIRLGQHVPAWVVRPYEFLNYYRFGYEPAQPGRVRVVAQMRPSKIDGEFTFQAAVQSEKAASPRRNMNITFVLDTSGSMAGPPIAIEIAAIKAMASVMQKGDRVSMITWNTQNRVLLDGYVVTGPDDPQIVNRANVLTTDGGTDLSGGLAVGYDIARRNYDKARLNRVVLISDGMANVGQTDENIIGQASHNEDQEGIYLVGVSVGDGINDTLMNVVTDKGRGAYVYLDSPEEAARMLKGRFDETMDVAARGVRLELTLPWYFAMKAFSGEMSSTNPNAVDPQHLAPDDAMVFNETFVACSPAMTNGADTIKVRATYQTPLTHEDREDSTSATISELLSGRDTELRKGSAIFAYALALRDVERHPNVAAATLDAALAQIREADSANSDLELEEIADLLVQYRKQYP